jgi:hypothetical protein
VVSASVAAAVVVSAVLLPQAARDSTITPAIVKEISFLIDFLMYVLHSYM